ncbi:ATP-binding protein [Streptomyces sp. NPDC002018]|uniref:ATP-binding protein n=1 Tax=Streptomyces sp. NPDC002018 TaxID=3364629 RepID=UPI0036CD56BD
MRELVANVIRHVGEGTPTTLMVSMRGTRVCIEVRDPETRALPTLVAPESDAESGRGMMLVDELADRWGVLLGTESKIEWCELATTLTSQSGHTGGLQVTRAEALLKCCGVTRPFEADLSYSLSVAAAEQAVIGTIADLLRWLRVHGCEPGEALNHALARFEVELDEVN